MAGVAIAGALAASPAGAQPPGEHGGPFGHGLFDAPHGPLVHRVDGWLDGLGVTPAQRAQIRDIVTAAEADLRAQREAGRGLRERGVQIFAAPTVDANAAESLRQEMATQQDHASRRVLTAMLDVAKVLTPEQRAKIGLRMQERQAVRQERRERLAQEHGPARRPPAPPTR